MAAPADQTVGPSFGPDDPRGCKERLEDLHRIYLQVANINRRQTDSAVRDDMIRQLVQHHAGPTDVVQFDPVPDGAGDVVLVVRDELVVPAPWCRRCATGRKSSTCPSGWKLSATGHWWPPRSTLGEGIWSTYASGTESPIIDPDPEEFGSDSWALWTGTSFAAPQVAGASRESHKRMVSPPGARCGPCSPGNRSYPSTAELSESCPPEVALRSLSRSGSRPGSCLASAARRLRARVASGRH